VYFFICLFRKYVDKVRDVDDYKSTIQSKLDSTRLACFQQLSNKNVEWSSLAFPVTDPTEGPVVNIKSCPIGRIERPYETLLS